MSTLSDTLKSAPAKSQNRLLACLLACLFWSVLKTSHSQCSLASPRPPRSSPRAERTERALQEGAQGTVATALMIRQLLKTPAAEGKPAEPAATGPPPPRRRAAGGEDLFARRARLLEGDELALSGKVEEKQKDSASPPSRESAGGEDLFARRARLLEGDELALSGKKKDATPPEAGKKK